ncbi:MAG: hypothetical protein JKY15_05205 [Deltaproteobacteria bacterium]|nr:hypothetical protein [Deltaproteobacteria bacterium]
MSEIQKAFDSGNYALVRKLAKQRPSSEAQKLMARIQTDSKIIWAGLFGVIAVLAMALWTLG